MQHWWLGGIVFGVGLALGQAQAQTALSGLVSSSEEGPMEGVLVSAKREGSTITTTVATNGHGRYEFPASRMERGKYAIAIRAIGYQLDGPKTVEVHSHPLPIMPGSEATGTGSHRLNAALPMVDPSDVFCHSASVGSDLPTQLAYAVASEWLT